MGRRNPSLTASLCLSLAIHGLGFAALVWWVILHAMSPRLAPISRMEVRRAAEPTDRTAPPPPRPKLPAFEQQPMPKDDSGEADARGTANRSTPGEREMQSRAGYHQADLMRDALPPDASAFDDSKLNPAQAGEKDGANTTPTPAPAKGAYHPDFVADAAREQRARRDASAAARPTPRADGPGPLPAVPGDAAPPPTPNGSADGSASATATPAAPAPPPRQVTGRRAVPSDTDSDPFAKTDSVTFHDGRVDAREGLKVRTVRPRWSLSSDQAGADTRRFTLGAYVDASGNVYNVVVLTGSGSDFVDNDAREAVYGWWFEPPKDAAGHPKATQWTIRFN